jgi:hypothetical protein
MLEYNSCPPGFSTLTLDPNHYPQSAQDFTQADDINYKTSSSGKNDDKNNAMEDDLGCEICKSKDDGERMLLCDGCDLGYHSFCLTPKLVKLPKGKWFCDNCKTKKAKEESFHQCEKCKKIFISLGGYKYHMNNVCVTREIVSDDEFDISNRRKKRKNDEQIEIDINAPRKTRERKPTAKAVEFFKSGTDEHDNDEDLDDNYTVDSADDDVDNGIHKTRGKRKHHHQAGGSALDDYDTIKRITAKNPMYQFVSKFHRPKIPTAVVENLFSNRNIHAYGLWHQAVHHSFDSWLKLVNSFQSYGKND